MITRNKLAVSTVKLLAYTANTEIDQLSLKIGTLNRQASTRRQILSKLSEVLDPIGISSTLLFKSKTLLRSIADLKIGWDEPVPTSIIQQFLKLCEVYEKYANSYVTPRKMVVVNIPADIAIFADASKTAYGFVAYLIQGNHQNCMLVKLNKPQCLIKHYRP